MAVWREWTLSDFYTFGHQRSALVSGWLVLLIFIYLLVLVLGTPTLLLTEAVFVRKVCCCYLYLTLLRYSVGVYRKQIFKYIFLVCWVSKFQVYIYFLHEDVFYFLLEKNGMMPLSNNVGVHDEDEIYFKLVFDNSIFLLKCIYLYFLSFIRT